MADRILPGDPDEVWIVVKASGVIVGECCPYRTEARALERHRASGGERVIGPFRLAAEVERLRAENERLRAAVRDYDTCVVCEASLVPHDGPMHCEDCIVTDDHYYAWQARRGGSPSSSPEPAHDAKEKGRG